MNKFRRGRTSTSHGTSSGTSRGRWLNRKNQRCGVECATSQNFATCWGDMHIPWLRYFKFVMEICVPKISIRWVPRLLTPGNKCNFLTRFSSQNLTNTVKPAGKVWSLGFLLCVRNCGLSRKRTNNTCVVIGPFEPKEKKKLWYLPKKKLLFYQDNVKFGWLLRYIS